MDLIDIYRAFHPKQQNTFFSSAHGTFSRIDHMLGHKTGFSKFKKTEIISSIFANHNAMRLEINYKKKKLTKIKNLPSALAFNYGQVGLLEPSVFHLIYLLTGSLCLW